MIYSKRHSQNAVAAKQRKAIEVAQSVSDEPNVKIKAGPRSRAVVQIQIRCFERGDSLTLTLHRAPWPNRWLCAQGEFSSAHIARTVAEILKSSTMPNP